MLIALDEEVSQETKLLRSVRHGMTDFSMVTQQCHPTIH